MPFFIFLSLQISQNFINVTGGKFATGINNTSDAGDKSCRPVALIWWCTLICEYLHDFTKKIRNDPTIIFRGLGEEDS
jgi:hypothetical protein